MVNLKIKIVGLQHVEWRKLKWLQNENYKVTDDERQDKLKKSLKKHIIRPFYVWKDKKNIIWILDGHRREAAMKQLETEGFIFPDKLPALFIECKNKKEAAEFMLTYDSNYSDVTIDGMKDFMELNNLLLKDIENTSIHGIDLSMFIKNDSDDTGSISQIETAKNLSDVYIVVGEFRILIERNIYLEWIEEIKQKHGFDKLSVMKEIKKRLRIK